jgi:hypothetical protein
MNNNIIGGIFNAIWSFKLTPYIIVIVIVIYIFQKRGGKG